MSVKKVGFHKKRGKVYEPDYLAIRSKVSEVHHLLVDTTPAEKLERAILKMTAEVTGWSRSTIRKCKDSATWEEFLSKVTKPSGKQKTEPRQLPLTPGSDTERIVKGLNPIRALIAKQEETNKLLKELIEIAKKSNNISDSFMAIINPSGNNKPASDSPARATVSS
jgi:hypothetical protein